MNMHATIVPGILDLDALFAGYLAEAEATHDAFLATTEQRHRAVLNECNVAIEDARETARATLEALGEIA